MKKLFLSTLIAAAFAAAGPAAAEGAFFNPSTQHLYVPELRLDGAHVFKNVWVRFEGFGTVTVGELGASATDVQYDTAQQRLRIPVLFIGASRYEQVTLTQSSFELVRADGVPSDSGEAGPYTLVVQTVHETPPPHPIIIWTHAQKPATQQEFCSNTKLQRLLLEDPDGTPYPRTTLSNCRYDGVQGIWDRTYVATPTIRQESVVTFTYSP
ncbi:MAG: hypothetical protein KKH21_00635 [Gammaproteobacteria bacterium]|nr:hypothetical protein [Gammaproteobacteria bacterium]MBU1816127.1 hypothetical protein [Gammaproteobacteria bacterium]